MAEKNGTVASKRSKEVCNEKHARIDERCSTTKAACIRERKHLRGDINQNSDDIKSIKRWIQGALVAIAATEATLIANLILNAL